MVPVGFCLVLLAACTRCDPISDLPKGENLDKLLAAAMEVALDPRDGVPGLARLKESKELILAKNSNIPPFAVPGFDNIVELEKHQIQKRAEEMGRYMYLGVSCCKIEKRLVKIAVYTQWALPEDNEILILSGGSIRMEFCKHKDKWRLKKALVVVS